jgi:hypothetical protein
LLFCLGLLLVLGLLLLRDLFVGLGVQQFLRDQDVGDEEVLGLDVVLLELGLGEFKRFFLELRPLCDELERLFLASVVSE